MLEQTHQWASDDPTIFAIGVLVVVLIHFVPTFVAYARNHASRLLILVLNLLMGWTIIGWFVLLLWASKGKDAA